MDGPINVALTLDKAYQMPALVAIYSATANYRGAESLRFFVITDAQDSAFEHDVRQVVGKHAVSFIYKDLAAYKGELWQSGHLSNTLAQYYRLFLTSLLPAEVDRVIYLDCDLVVKGCLSELWRLDLHDKLTLAAKDEMTFGSLWGIEVALSLGLPGDGAYFNSGVMVIDVAGWKREKVCERALALSLDYGPLFSCWDQCALNAVLHSRWGQLDAAWNKLAYLPSSQWPPKIFHYSSIKPWRIKLFGPAGRAFYRAYASAPFDKTRYPIRPELSLDGLKRCFSVLRVAQAAAFRRLLRGERSALRPLWPLPLVILAELLLRPRNLASRICRFVLRRVSPKAGSLGGVNLSKLAPRHRDLLPPKAFTNAYFYVQIGAYDGTTDDEFFPMAYLNHWRGLLLEPQPGAFEKLQRVYAKRPSLKCLQLVLSDHVGKAKFYSVDPNRFRDSRWAHQIASLNRDVLLKHSKDLKDLEDATIEHEVDCLTFTELARRYGIKEIDLLQVDTEGHDYEIIKTIDFVNLAPHMIRFEHKHLKPTDFAACRALLERQGYRLIVGDYDAVAKRLYPAGGRPQGEASAAA